MSQIRVEKNVGGIEGLCVITPAVHGDARGYFMETYSERDMREAGIDIRFVQDNQSVSVRGVLREIRNIWKMVWRDAVGGEQKAVLDSEGICARLPRPERRSGILL